MGKINIGGELNPIYGRVASAKHIYDYSNKRSQEKINSLLLNELFSFDLGLKITSFIGGVETEQNIIEYKEKDQTVSCSVNWDIKRKHDFDFVFDNEVCPNGIVLESDNIENSVLTVLNNDKKWSKSGKTDLKAGPGKTTVTMSISMDEGFFVSDSKSFWLVPPIYYGFSVEEKGQNDLASMLSKKNLAISPAGRYKVVNETKGTDEEGNEILVPAYFYICIPQSLGISEIEVTSSGFKVPFDKVMDNNPNTGFGIYDCWRNPIGSMVKSGSEIIYDVTVRK